MRPWRVALWGAWYGSRNVGDQAILATLPALLEEAIGRCRFTVFTDDAAHVRLVGRRLSGCDVRARQNWRELPWLLANLARSDLFVIGGGVPFYEQPYHLAVMAGLVGTARTFGTPYLTWSVASQTIRRRSAHRLHRWVLDGAAGVTCRDRYSEEQLLASGTRAELVRAGDPALHLTWGPAEERAAQDALERAGVDDDRPLVSFTARRTRPRHSYSAEHYNAKTRQQVEGTIDKFAAAVDRVWRLGMRPLFVPMNTVDPDDDRVMARSVIERAEFGGEARCVNDQLEPAPMAALLARCRFGVTSRLHAAVLSSISCTPSVIHAIGPKLTGIAEELGLGSLATHDENDSTIAVADSVEALSNDLESVERRLASRVGELRVTGRLPAEIARSVLASRRP